MFEIYLSSTYGDLRKCRESAYRVLRKLGHHVIAMEDYVASDERPLDKCLADVQNSDVYVGIFAWRYGFIPPGHDRSITELELQCARESNVPILAFLVADDAPWPPTNMDHDENRQKVLRLREDLKLHSTVGFFRDAESLATEVATAISQLAAAKKPATPDEAHDSSSQSEGGAEEIQGPPFDERPPFSNEPLASPFAKSWGRPPRMWIAFRKFKNLLRFASVRATATVTVMLTWLAVLAPIHYYIWASSTRRSIEIGAVIVSIALVAFTVWLVLRQSLLRMPPSEYAPIVIGGRKVSVTFRWIAWEMWDLCTTFIDYKYTIALRAHHRDLLILLAGILKDWPGSNSAALRLLQAWLTSGRRRQIEHAMTKLSDRLFRQRIAVQRVDALKGLAADECGISRRRLCDHVFRFSPSIYERRSGKVVSNWRQIIGGLETDFFPVARIRDLLEENERIYTRIERRINYLVVLMGMTDLYDLVYAFTGQPSVRTALASYAEALSKVASSIQLPAERRRLDVPLGEGKAYKIGRARLVALYFMQRAHAGMDLHATLVNLCKKGNKWCLAQADKRQRFERRNVTTYRQRAAVWMMRANLLQQFGRADEFLTSDIEQNLATLRDMFIGVVTAVYNSQSEITRRFRDWYVALHGSRQNVFVVVFGYSKVVRDALKCGILSLTQGYPKRAFVVRSADDEFYTRLMDFELREDRRWIRQGESARLGYGNERLIQSMMEDATAHMVVVVGAEAFDSKGRVVLTGDVYDRIQHLRNDCDPDRTRFVVLAEGYKHYDDLTKQSDLYRDHLDEVVLTGTKVFDGIASDDLIGWAGKLAANLLSPDHRFPKQQKKQEE